MQRVTAAYYAVYHSASWLEATWGSSWPVAAPTCEESYRQPEPHYSKNNFCPRSGGHKRVEHVLLLEASLPSPPLLSWPKPLPLSLSLTLPLPRPASQSQPKSLSTNFHAYGKASSSSPSAVTVNFPYPGHWKWNASQPAKANQINYTSIYHQMYMYLFVQSVTLFS